MDFQYERALEEPVSIDIEGVEVLLYENSDEGSIYAAWVDNNVNYNLFGILTREELIQIITSMGDSGER